MRTRVEIDQEYSIIARVYGDRVFKGAMLQNEIKALHDKMTALSQEPAAQEAPHVVVEKKNEPVAAEDAGSPGPA